MARHLLFYDGECGLCDHLVQFLLKVDTRQLFLFAPLQGDTAKQELASLPASVRQADSLILIENYQKEDARVWIYGRGALRVAWLLGGCWILLGCLSFLPPVLYDWGYRLLAKNRTRMFSKNACRLPKSSEKNRFLP